MERAVGILGPVVEVVPDFEVDSDGGTSALVMVAHRTGSTHSYFTGIPDVSNPSPPPTHPLPYSHAYTP